MRFTRFMIFLTPLLTTKALAKEIEISISKEKPIRTIWISPSDPKILVFPGDVSYCYNSTKFLRTATADATKVDDGQFWVREIAVGLNLKELTEENVGMVESTEFVLRCKFLDSNGSYISKRIPVRVDTYNKHANEETYVFSIEGKSILNSTLKKRIKSYGTLEIKGDKLLIPTIVKSQNSEPYITIPQDENSQDEPNRIETNRPDKKRIKSFRTKAIGA